MMLRHTKGDMPAARMADQMHAPFAERTNESRHIRRMARNGEISILTPFVGPAMAQADGDGVILRAKSFHLPGKGTLIAQRAMHHHHRRATAGFGIGNRITINAHCRHHTLLKRRAQRRSAP